MAEPIGTLRAELSAGHAQFASDMKKAKGAVQKNAKGMSAAMGKVKKKFTEAAKALTSFSGIMAGAAMVGGMLYAIKKNLEYADTIAKTADKIGITTKALQEYRYIAERSGVSTSSLDGAFEAFGKRIGELRMGTGALYTILNKSNQSLMGQLVAAGNTTEALDIYFDALKNITNQNDRAALSAAAFGRTAGVGITLMVDNVDTLRDRFRRLGIEIDEKLLRGAEGAKDNIDDLQAVIKTSLASALSAVGPELGQVAADMAQWVASNNDFITQDMPAKIDAIKDSVGDIKDVYDDIPKEITGGVGVIGATLFGKKIALIVAAAMLLPKLARTLKGFGAVAEGELSFLEFAKMNAEELKEALDAIDKWAAEPKRHKVTYPSDAPPPPDVPPPEETPAEKAAREKKEKLAKETNARRLELEQKFQNELELITREGVARELEALKQGYEKEFAAAEKLNADTTALTEAYEIEKAGIITDAEEDIANKRKAFADEHKKAILSDVDYELLKIQELYDYHLTYVKDKAALDEWYAASKEKILDREAEKADESLTDMEQAFAGWGNSFSSTLNDMLWGADVTFRSIAESFGKMITQMMIQKQIIEPMFGGGEGAGWLNVGLKVAGAYLGGSGASTGAAPAGISAMYPNLAFAKGGAFADGISEYSNQIINKPTYFAKGANIMGEAGPEAIMPLKRTPEGDLGISAEGRGKTTNIIINAIDSKSFAEVVRRNPQSIITVVGEALESRTGLLDTIRGTI